MRKNLALCAILLPAVLLTACIRDVQPLPDLYTPFPEPEILSASFYYQRDGKDVTGDEAGTITRNDDGTYKVRMKRRVPSNVPTAMFVTGSFEFSEYYKIVCTFPEDPAIADKPYRVYACASRGMDAAVDADYPTARDLKGQAVFRNGVAIGTFEMTNEGVNTLKPDRRGRPYITVFLYLYFNNVSDPDDYYEFTLDYAGGANGFIPESKVVKAAAFRDGDTEHQFVLPPPGAAAGDNYILARFNHRYDSRTISAVNTASLNLNLKVPDNDAGKEMVFEIRNTGLFSENSDNLITRDMIKAAKVLAGTTEAEQTEIVTEMEVNSNPVSYYYTVKVKTASYADLFGEPGTGVKLVIPGEGFNNTNRFTFTFNVPDKYVGEEP